MRLPSGYGSIIKKGGKRRRPFAVRITVGWTDEGKQLYKYLGYFATRKEAISCLDNYNENPYNIDSRALTFSDIYKKWADWRYISHDEKVPNGNADSKAVRFALIYIYTGLRPTELLRAKTEGVFISERYLRAGMKTKGGKTESSQYSPSLKNYMTKTTSISLLTTEMESQ